MLFLHVLVTRGDIPSRSGLKSVPGADLEEQGRSETPDTSTTCRSLVADMNKRSGGQPSNEDGLARVPGRPKVDVFFAHAASAAVRDVPHNYSRLVSAGSVYFASTDSPAALLTAASSGRPSSTTIAKVAR